MNKEEKLEKKKMSTVKKVILSVLLVLILAIVSFIIYEVATVNNTYYIGEKNLQIPVFVYHDIVEDESQIEYDYMQTTVKQFADYQSTATAKVTTLETENAKYVEENLKLKAANFDLISKQPANIEQKQDEPTIKTISDLFEEK